MTIIVIMVLIITTNHSRDRFYLSLSELMCSRETLFLLATKYRETVSALFGRGIKNWEFFFWGFQISQSRRADKWLPTPNDKKMFFFEFWVLSFVFWVLSFEFWMQLFLLHLLCCCPSRVVKISPTNNSCSKTEKIQQ